MQFDSDDPAKLIVEGLLKKLSKEKLALLTKNVLAIGVLRVASACSGSNVVGFMLAMLFASLQVGEVVDEYCCESVLGLVARGLLGEGVQV